MFVMKLDLYNMYVINYKKLFFFKYILFFCVIKNEMISMFIFFYFEFKLVNNLKSEYIICCVCYTLYNLKFYIFLNCFYIS